MAVCDHEILELFLFDAVPRRNTNPMAHALLDRFGSLLGVFAADKAELMKIPGVGEGVVSYIKGTYEEYCGRMRRALICGRPVTTAQIRNYLIWHRMNVTASRGDLATVVALKCDGSVSSVYDTDAVLRAVEEEISRGTHTVIIGTEGMEEDVLDALLCRRFVADVIYVTGVSAEGLKRAENTLK